MLMMSGVFQDVLPEVSSSWLNGLIRSFEIESPAISIHPPSRDFDVVLRALCGEDYEQWPTFLCGVLRRRLFLVAPVTVMCVIELHALPSQVAFYGNNVVFVTPLNFRPRLRQIPILFLSTLSSRPYQTLWVWTMRVVSPPVWALRFYLKYLRSVSPHPKSVHGSPTSKPSRPIFKNALLFFLHKCISGFGAVLGPTGNCTALTTHSISRFSTSASFMKNWSLKECSSGSLLDVELCF